MPASQQGFLCPPCNRTFVDRKSREQHIRDSSRHPKCLRCDRGFLDQSAFDNHIANSAAHFHDLVEVDGPPSWSDYSYFPEPNFDFDYDDDPTPPGHFAIDDSEQGDYDQMIAEHLELADEDMPPSFLGYHLGAFFNGELDDDESVWEGHAAELFGEHLYGPDDDESDPPSEDEHVADDVLQAVAAEEPTSNAALGNCPICVSPYKGLTATHCGHVFCASCVVSALQAQLLCPVCRTATSMGGLRRIYL